MTKTLAQITDLITNLTYEMAGKDHFITQLQDEIARLESIIIGKDVELLASQDVAYMQYIEEDYRNIGRECDLLTKIVDDKSNTIRIKDTTIANMRMENRSYKSEIGSLKREIEMKDREIAQLKTETLDNFETCIIDPAMFDRIPGFTGFASCGNGCAVVKTARGSFDDMHESTCPESDEYDDIMMGL